MAQLLYVLSHVNFKRLKPKTSLPEVGWRAGGGKKADSGVCRGHGISNFIPASDHLTGFLTLHFRGPCRGRSCLHYSVIPDCSRKPTLALTISSNPHCSTLEWLGEPCPKRVLLLFWDMGRRPAVFYRKGGLTNVCRFRLLQVAVLKGGRREAVRDPASGRQQEVTCHSWLAWPSPWWRRQKRTEGPWSWLPQHDPRKTKIKLTLPSDCFSQLSGWECFVHREPHPDNKAQSTPHYPSELIQEKGWGWKSRLASESV